VQNNLKFKSLKILVLKSKNLNYVADTFTILYLVPEFLNLGSPDAAVTALGFTLAASYKRQRNNLPGELSRRIFADGLLQNYS
jgi:hypothetical protein